MNVQLHLIIIYIILNDIQNINNDLVNSICQFNLNTPCPPSPRNNEFGLTSAFNDDDNDINKW